MLTTRVARRANWGSSRCSRGSCPSRTCWWTTSRRASGPTASSRCRRGWRVRPCEVTSRRSPGENGGGTVGQKRSCPARTGCAKIGLELPSWPPSMPTGACYSRSEDDRQAQHQDRAAACSRVPESSGSRPGASDPRGGVRGASSAAGLCGDRAGEDLVRCAEAQRWVLGPLGRRCFLGEARLERRACCRRIRRRRKRSPGVASSSSSMTGPSVLAVAIVGALAGTIYFVWRVLEAGAGC